MRPWIFLFFCFLVSCDQVVNQQGQPIIDAKSVSTLLDAAEDFSLEATELTKPNRVQAWVAPLIVTAQPGPGMPEIARLQEGEMAEYLYQRTLRKVKRQLREQEFYERYILIRTKDGQMGWVFEGGVKFVRPGFTEMLNQTPATGNTNQRIRGDAPTKLPSEDFQIVPGRRVGAIRVNTSEEKLMQIYGPAQVSRSTLTNPEGQQLPCTVVMGGLANELKIVWKDNDFKRIKEVHFERPDSRWFTGEGLTTGISLSELTKVNQNPMTFYGFDWEYGGTSSSWKRGKLGRYTKKFYLRLKPHVPAGTKVPDRFTGNKVLSSNEEGLTALGITVDKIVVYLD
ncbi:MAG: hypothetical protein AAFR61_06935 [Bacteroidota bacterium]